MSDTELALADRDVANAWYMDTSAALKLLVEEAESEALAERLDAEGRPLVSAQLMETEMRRAVHRGLGFDQQQVTDLLDGIDLYDMPASVFRAAGHLPGAHLRSLDALHLATAVRLGVAAVVSYDVRMVEAARHLGLTVVSPAATRS